MHTVSTFRHWTHVAHDDEITAARVFMRMLHERAFWGIVAILAALTTLLALALLFGESRGDDQSMPIYYGVHRF